MLRKLIASFRAKQVLHDISTLLGDQVLTLLDIGAAGGIQPRWKQITRKTAYIGFEPDARSNVDIAQAGKDFASHRLIPTAVWNRDGELGIHLCRKPQVSSHFPPNDEFLQKFPKPERFDVVGSTTVSANCLDTLDIDRCDFIKLDIQGGELAALEGGEILLGRTLGLEIEVEFLSLYQGQPLFGDLCAHLARHGFEFMDFTSICRWDRRMRTGLGQCVFADGLFLRSPEYIRQQFDRATLSLPDVRRYLAVLTLYRRVELMETCQRLFAEELRQEGNFGRNVAGVIRRLNRELRSARFLSRMLSRYVLRFLGNNIRLHITY